jgi:hypothetical protein
MEDKLIVFGLLFLEVFIFFISFLFSLKLVKNKNIVPYMKGFYWYHFVGIVIGVIGVSELLWIGKNSFFVLLNNLSIFFHYTFLCNFIKKATPNKSNPVLYTLIGVYIIGSVVMLGFYLNFDITNQANFAFSIAHFILFLYCVIYYLQLLNNIPQVILLKEPAFWVVTGVLFSSSLTIPITFAGNYFGFKYLSNYIFLVSLLTVLPYIILHLFLIKAILCSTNPIRA